MAFLKRENISSISGSEIIKGGQQALMSPGRVRRIRPCCWACATRWAPIFWEGSKNLLFLFVANEFNSTDQSEASGSSNHRMFLQFPKSFGKTGCQVTDSLNQVTFFIYFQRLQSHGGRYRMPAVGITVAEHAESGTLFTHHLVDCV